MVSSSKSAVANILQQQFEEQITAARKSQRPGFQPTIIGLKPRYPRKRLALAPATNRGGHRSRREPIFCEYSGNWRARLDSNQRPLA